MTEGKYIGLIGLGYWGNNLLRNLYELNVLHTACDVDEKLLMERKSQFPGIEYVNSFEKVLQIPEIKAAAIATPAASHYELIKKALLAGKDVFVEKPLALTMTEGQELVQLAEQKKRILMVDHILQYHPAVIKLKELIKAGELGKIQYIYSNRLNIGKLRTEENILWSFAPHDISIILMLMDEEPLCVSTFGGAYLNEGIYDTTLSMFEFANGVKAHIFVSWLHPFKEQKLVVVGTKAMAVFDDVSEEKLFLYPHTIEWRNGKVPIAQKAQYQVVPFAKGEPLKIEMQHFLMCVKERKRPKTDGQEALKVLKILEACQTNIEQHSLSQGIPEIQEISPKIDKKYFVHESSFVDDQVEIGDGTKIWHYCHILKNTKIGQNCIFGQNVMVGPNVIIGNRVKVQNYVSIYESVELEDEVFCAPSMVFTNVINPRAFIERKTEFRKTLVKRGATLGANSTIICGVTIGEYALIGAGAVVTKEVLPYALVTGVPARQTGWVCKCGNTLKGIMIDNRMICRCCGLQYVKEGEHLRLEMK
ncbi:MAG: oxidoreductase [Candidatus Fischerbacteria bacterium RBG_13_37_8]|uniref:Oxidoreductase n=1 Tax=Candidatus Fischerbacteria bacterium RBG_13_37_8 TaxID=1817863 RepID=A0A1F5VG84_9BACT|nr:MAG: oxidoreductase [Candidatus Fischerbacteria bacterium RBG_13_37_8]